MRRWEIGTGETLGVEEGSITEGFGDIAEVTELCR
jgi:hypothetical protein